MQRLLMIFCLTLLLAACAQPNNTPPTPTADLIATSQVYVDATLTALVPTQTQTQPATDTPIPTLFLSETPTSTPENTRTPKPPKAPFYSGCFTPTGVSKQEAPFKIENYSKGRIAVYINGTTRRGEHPIHCSYRLAKNDEVVFTIWWGDYTYSVELNGKTTFTGSFWVNNEDKATMRVTADGVKLGPFP